MVGVNEGNTGRILKPSVTEPLFLCGDSVSSQRDIGDNKHGHLMYNLGQFLSCMYRIPMFGRF